MRIGTMIKQLLEEVKAAPLDEAARDKLAELHERSVNELKGALSDELAEEIDRIVLPRAETPSEAEIRVAHAQLVGGRKSTRLNSSHVSRSYSDVFMKYKNE